MNKRRWLLTILMAVFLGFGVVGALNGSYQIFAPPSNERATKGWLSIDNSDRPEPMSPEEALLTSRTEPESVSARGINGVTPTLTPLVEALRSGPDLDDVLLLYDSWNPKDFDTNLCRVAEFYGLLCRRVDLRSIELTDTLFRDDRGDYFKLIGVAADHILGDTFLFSSRELDLIQSEISVQGSTLLISNVGDRHNSKLLDELTQGAIVSVGVPPDIVTEWTITKEAPKITREFTGQSISPAKSELEGDFTLSIADRAPLTILFTSTDGEGTVSPIFAKLTLGVGSIFIDSARERGNIEDLSFRGMYYDTSRFSSIVPIMLATKYALGDEAWHSSHDYANLTIDGSPLAEPVGGLSYIGLLSEMEAHNFHTTITMHPVSWTESESAVISLFLAYPERYSVVQRGNNGDGYEFYVYDESDSRELDGMILPPRPLSDQEADILQGAARMENHRILTGIPFDKVMIFPWGISPEPTLGLLKKHNFLGTVNAQDVPLLATPPSNWDFGMRQAITEYENFPALTRRHPGAYEPFRPNLTPFVLDLFIDKPALIYSDASQLFAPGVDTFNPVADEINRLEGEVEWLGLGDILKRLHLQKLTEDGSIDIKMYGNQLVFVNESDFEMTYHIAKDETLNVPISVVTVNGYEFPYRIDEGLLTIDVLVPAKTAAEINIKYGN